MPNSVAPPLARLLEIMAHLRQSPDGCAWTKEQTHQSLVPYLIEESYETADAIDRGKTEHDLKDELGDILLQIAFHTEIAKEKGTFTFDDVAQSIVDKLERRYPTILGSEPNTLKTAAEIDKRWEEIKAEERKRKGLDGPDASVLDEISYALPALLRAAKLKSRAAKAGWDWPDSALLMEKIFEEMNELRAELESKNINKEAAASEIGDILFLMVDFARWYGIDAEDALRSTNNRFERRFRFMEKGLKVQGKDFKTSTRDERKALWDEIKTIEKKQVKSA